MRPEQDFVEPQPEPPPPGAASRVDTAVPLERLAELNTSLLTLPTGFTVHRKLERARDKRAQVLAQPDERSVDWATAEELAMASILSDGISIRLTGEDVERGTFSQRHAVFHDVETGAVHVPLQTLPQARAAFEIHNSPLSENAVVGFEYGYNVQEPSRLVIWEAQYGDFFNGAQVILDEFISSARVKWGQRPSLVLLLPHAHEGQGPDHASARPERFLQLCADINMRVANCTTAAQYFHLLRRQAALLLTDPLPLVVLTPKSLLRHPMVASAPRELAEGRFRMLIDDEDARRRAADIRRVVVCSGKVYVDLMSSERRAAARQIAICRLEQLYPLPMRELRAMLERVFVGRRDCLGSGRAREHGRVGIRASAPDRGCRRPARARDRAPAQREPGGGLGGPPFASAAGAGGCGAFRNADEDAWKRRHETGDGCWVRLCSRFGVRCQGSGSGFGFGFRIIAMNPEPTSNHEPTPRTPNHEPWEGRNNVRKHRRP